MCLMPWSNDEVREVVKTIYSEDYSNLCIVHTSIKEQTQSCGVVNVTLSESLAIHWIPPPILFF